MGDNAGAVERGVQKGLSLYQLDMRAGLSAETVNILEMVKLRSSVMGSGEIGGISVVAGGVIGNKGDVVIDSIARPFRVIGVADGCGYLLSLLEEREYEDRLHRVRQAIIEARIRRGDWDAICFELPAPAARAFLPTDIPELGPLGRR